MIKNILRNLIFRNVITLLYINLIVFFLISLSYVCIKINNLIYSTPQIIAFIKVEIPDNETTDLISSLKSDNSIKQISFVGKDEAFYDFIKYININGNEAGSIRPLIPGNIEITLSNLSDINRISSMLRTHSIVKDVKTIDNSGIKLAGLSKLLSAITTILVIILSSITILKFNLIIRATKQINISTSLTRLKSFYQTLFKLLALIYVLSIGMSVIFLFPLTSLLNQDIFTVNDFYNILKLICGYSTCIILISASLVPVIIKPDKKHAITRID